MTAPDPGLPGSELVFRRDRRSWWPPISRIVTALVFGAIAALVREDRGLGGIPLGPPALVVAGLIGLGALRFVVAYFWQGQFRTVLTPAGIQIRGYVRHFVPWSEVAGFRLRHGRAVQIVRTSGRHLTLAAPVVTDRAGDYQFGDKVRQLEHWRQLYGP